LIKKFLSKIEQKAKLLIKYREYKLLKKIIEEEKIYYYLEKDGKSILMQLIFSGKVGIAILRILNKKIVDENLDSGIIISKEKYTYSSIANSSKLNIELIPLKIPSFDVFQHNLVSNAKLLSSEERKRILKLYHAKPYQIPKMLETDTMSILLGAKQGDLIELSRDSITAGLINTYRYVS
jgi:DNA-directed RNA polymerase subunit H (RpoH/RPB5)